MIRYEAGLDGKPEIGEPFTDFNEQKGLEDILGSLNLKFEKLSSGRGGYYVYIIHINNVISKVHIYLKRITFGGRENRPYEKRVQFSSALDRAGFISIENESQLEFSLILGIYKKNYSDTIICAWNIHDWGHNIGRAFNCFVDVKSIALAFKNDFAQHVTSIGQIVCCFRPEKLLYYIDERRKLHTTVLYEATKSQSIIFKILDDKDLELEDSLMDEVPKYPLLFQLVLDILRSRNGIANTETIEIDAVRQLKLTDKARLLIHNENEGYRTEIGYQLAWSRFYLKKAGYIINPKRQIWSLTELGWSTPLIDKGEIIKIATKQDIQHEIDNDNLFSISSENDIEDENDIDEFSIAVPFDPNLVDIRTRTMSLDLILRRLKTDAIDMNTSFQRKANLWNITKQSRLIESILVRFPLPAFYFDGSNDNKWLVVDGLQRLSSLNNYVNKEIFTLQNLEFLTQFNGKKFSELPPHLQRRIEEFEITSYVIAAGTPKELKFNVFKRINTGGLTLTTQEIRNALYQGKATNFVKKLAELKSFKIATTFTIPEDRLLDNEFVNRFLAFYLFPISNYNSDLDGFLNKALDEINLNPNLDLDMIEADFDKAMKCAFKIFDRDAFRKRFNVKDKRKPINKALFEVWSVELSKLHDDDTKVLTVRKNQLKKKFISLFQTNDNFNKSITSGTADKTRVKTRFNAVQNIIHITLQE